MPWPKRCTLDILVAFSDLLGAKNTNCGLDCSLASCCCGRSKHGRQTICHSKIHTEDRKCWKNNQSERKWARRLFWICFHLILHSCHYWICSFWGNQMQLLYAFTFRTPPLVSAILILKSNLFFEWCILLFDIFQVFCFQTSLFPFERLGEPGERLRFLATNHMAPIRLGYGNFEFIFL